MNLNKLTPEARRDLFGKIAYTMHVEADELDQDVIDDLLNGIVPVLQEYGDQDAFGTEGWEHHFGVTD